MAQNLLACDRDQSMLLPPDMREWLSRDHLAWFVIDAVDELDLGDFYASYRDDGQGAAAHDPEMMVALLLYAYSVGETSTRSIERRLREDVAFRVIAANQAPDHTTISRFRSRHQEALAELFGQILVLCERAGLLHTKTLAVDGTKLQANASLDANRTHEEIRADVERYFKEAEEVDRHEDELYGERRGDELPEHLAEPDSRRKALRKAKAELEREEVERRAEHAELVRHHEEHIARTGRRPVGRPPGKEPPKPSHPGRPAKRNLTDSDSRAVRDKGAIIQGYNAQAVVSESQVIIAADLTNDANDTRMLEPMARQAEEQLQSFKPHPRPAVLADAGYWNTAQIENLISRGIEVIVPPKSVIRNRPRKSARRQGPQAERIDRLLSTEEGRALYDQRKHMVEPVFGQIKHLRGLRRLSRRGLAACRAEWKLIATTHNLLKLRTAALPA